MNASLTGKRVIKDIARLFCDKVYSTNVLAVDYCPKLSCREHYRKWHFPLSLPPLIAAGILINVRGYCNP